MSFSESRIALILPLVIAACGFQPVYAPGETGAALRGQVNVAAPADQDTFLLVQELETQLGRGSVGRYALSYDLRLREQGLGLTRDNVTTRFNLLGRADFVLTDLESDTVVFEGVAEGFTSYSDTGSTVDTLASRRDARARLMVILADQITARLYAQADLTGA